jgi:hypothetical protein
LRTSLTDAGRGSPSANVGLVKEVGESIPARPFRFEECIQPIDNHHVFILP